MRISMLDEKTYCVGDKNFCVGDVISLDGIIVPPPPRLATDLGECEPITAHALNTRIQSIVQAMRKIKATVVDWALSAQAPWDGAVAMESFEYEVLETELSYSIMRLFQAVQNHLDAPIPLTRELDSLDVVVAKRQGSAPLNFTKAWAVAKFKVNAVKLVADITKSGVDHDLSHRLRSPVNLVLQPEPLPSDKPLQAVADNVARVMLPYYDAATKGGTPILILWVTPAGQQYIVAPQDTLFAHPSRVSEILGPAAIAGVIDFRTSGAAAAGIYALLQRENEHAAAGVTITSTGFKPAENVQVPPQMSQLLQLLMKAKET